MPLLAYCVALQTAIPGPESLDFFDVNGLCCYYAEVANAEANTEAALQFHRVNTALFQTAPILPFRFPTTAANVSELKQTVALQAVHLRAALERLQHCVQFELIFSRKPEQTAGPSSGAEYLRQAQVREKQLAESREQVKSAATDYVQQWKEKTRNRDLRLFALVERRFQQGFSQILQSVTLPIGVECRVVGPWPATEFVDE